MSASLPPASSAPPDSGSEASDGEGGSHGFPAPGSVTSQGDPGGGVRQPPVKRTRRKVSESPAPPKPGSEAVQPPVKRTRRKVSEPPAPPNPGSEASGGGGSHGFPDPGSETRVEGGVVRVSEAGGLEGAESMGTLRSRHGKTSATEAADGSSAAPAALSSTQLTRPRFPSFPTTGKKKDLIEWQKECKRITAIYAAGVSYIWLIHTFTPTILLKNIMMILAVGQAVITYLNGSDPDNDLPTRMPPKAKDPDTVRAVYSLPDKAVVLQAARSVVSVSSFRQDGFSGTQCTGIIIQKWEESFLIVTSSKIVCEGFKLIDPIPKLYVVLPNAVTISDVQLLHVIDHYDIAILSVSLAFPLELPSIGCCPEYGQEVFLLARDKKSSLMTRRGEIKWLEEADYLGRNYYMFLSCELPKGGNGGQLIDHDGNTRGMAFYLDPYPAVLSISTIMKCVNMFMRFNRIARPMLDLGLRTVAFMDVENQDVMSHKYGINHGFIVDTVPYDSAAEKRGIRPGNVILSIGDQRNLTLPEVRVRDLNEPMARSFVLPITLT
ncbi:hypothetical protein HU200_006666 [Digitaria exilis]|uniref:PDZ domain-containing protein n=1 Tax=Digitaria exilis TaxID=1010633 RepID=A0A835FRS5_9POAL|nr:hypothetical protein HU200_006666 [Digitaria exilis]